MSMIRFSADNLPYPVQETTTDNTTPLVVAQLDESRNDTSATCLTDHDHKQYADKSTQTPVPFDKCLRPVEYGFTSQTISQRSDNSTSHSQTLAPFDEYSSPLEYESMGRKVSQHSEDSAVCSQMSTPTDEYLRPLDYESMITKPYQCNQTIAEFSHKPIPWEIGLGFLVYASDDAGKKPNVQTADYTVDDAKVTLPILLQGENKDDKSANCLINERSNPTSPLNKSSVLSDECSSPPEYDPITAIARQCTEGFPTNSGHCLVAASLKTTIPQEIDPALFVCTPGCGFWPRPMVMEYIFDDKPDECNEKMLLLSTLRPFPPTTGENQQMEPDI